MSYLTGYQYYNNSDNEPYEANWGSYQYVPLTHIVNNFMLMFVGRDKDIDNVDRFTVKFHAKRALQDLHYDAMREVKIVELSVCENLKVVLPFDYVNWVRISLYKGGVLRPLVQNMQTNFAIAHLQDNDCNILLDEDGDVMTGTSTLDYERITGAGKDMYLGPGSMTGRTGYLYEGSWYFDVKVGARYGLNTDTANANPTFRIDKKSGVINFSSEMSDELIVLEYVSDGMENGDDTDVVVNKLFETYMYAFTKWMILDNKEGTTRWKRLEAKKQKRAAWLNARIRINDLKPERIMQILRGRSKWLK